MNKLISVIVFLFIYFQIMAFLSEIFIFGCAGSSLLCKGSSWGEQGLLSSCTERAPQCGGFSCCRVQALGAWDSVAAAPGLSGCGSWAPGHRLNNCGA